MAKFSVGDEVEVRTIVEYASDKQHIGKRGKIERIANDDPSKMQRVIYSVRLSGDVDNWEFFESDLKSAVTRVQTIHQLERQIVKLKEEEFQESRDPVGLPVGSVFVYTLPSGTSGVIVKQSENQWREFYLRRPHEESTTTTHSKPLTDREVAGYLLTQNGSYICKPGE